MVLAFTWSSALSAMEFPAKMPTLNEVGTRLDRIDARIEALQTAAPGEGPDALAMSRRPVVGRAAVAGVRVEPGDLVPETDDVELAEEWQDELLVVVPVATVVLAHRHPVPDLVRLDPRRRLERLRQRAIRGRVPVRPEIDPAVGSDRVGVRPVRRRDRANGGQPAGRFAGLIRLEC